MHISFSHLVTHMKLSKWLALFAINLEGTISVDIPSSLFPRLAEQLII